jgi:hypothetical protein
VLLAGLVERDGPIENAVICNGHGGKLVGGGTGGDVFDPGGPIKKAVLGMDVKMSEARAAIGR